MENESVKVPLFNEKFSFESQSSLENSLKEVVKYTEENTYSCIFSKEQYLVEHTKDWDDLFVLHDNNKNICFNVKTRERVKAAKIASPNFSITNYYKPAKPNKNNKQIIIINCIKPYDTLSLKRDLASKMTEEFHLTVRYRGLGFVSSSMIVPLSESDIYTIENTSKGKSEFVTDIMTSPRFSAITKFTYENQFKANDHTIKEIEECYKTLIENIYDVHSSRK